MKLDGDIVEVNDYVYHITLGGGKVETIHDGIARVRMQRGKGIVNMADGGISGGKKVFYWSNPILLIPRKDQKAVLDEATELMAIATKLAQQRMKLVGGDDD